MWNMEGQGWLIEAKGLLGPGVQLETLGREKVSNLSYPQEYQWRLILMRREQHNVPLIVLYSCWLIVFKCAVQTVMKDLVGRMISPHLHFKNHANANSVSAKLHLTGGLSLHGKECVTLVRLAFHIGHHCFSTCWNHTCCPQANISDQL